VIPFGPAANDVDQVSLRRSCWRGSVYKIDKTPRGRIRLHLSQLVNPSHPSLATIFRRASAGHLPRRTLSLCLHAIRACGRLILVCAPGRFWQEHAGFSIRRCCCTLAAALVRWLATNGEPWQLFGAAVQGLRTLFAPGRPRSCCWLEHAIASQPLGICEQLTLCCFVGLRAQHQERLASGAFGTRDYPMIGGPQTRRRLVPLRRGSSTLPPGFQLLITGRRAPDWAQCGLRRGYRLGNQCWKSV